MKRVDTIARVRRAYYVQKWSVKKIVRELHVSRNIVRKILRTNETDFSYERERQPMPRIGPWQGQLEQFLSANVNKPLRERLSQIAGVLSRLQQARLGGQGLEKIMRMPVDHPPAETRVTCDRLSGSYVLEEAVFKHHSSAVPALTITRLQIRSGERVGLVGRNGAGKSTLLQALSGQLLTASGQVRIDALSIDAIDPADVRRDVAYLSQNARLFYGTLRDNLLLGRPDATEAELLEALDLAGGHAFLSQFERGWDYQILEGGRGLSGGQKQSILLARLMLRRPSVMLLDEPTSAMDDMTERAFIESLRRASADRTLIIATHRQRILQLVDRLIVLDRGRIVLDGPRDDVLAKMRKGPA